MTSLHADFLRTAATFEEFLPVALIKSATWLHFVHEMAVLIFQSPQNSYMVLAEMHPAQWVTLHKIRPTFFIFRDMRYFAILFREVQFIIHAHTIFFWVATHLCMVGRAWKVQWPKHLMSRPCTCEKRSFSTVFLYVIMWPRCEATFHKQVKNLNVYLSSVWKMSLVKSTCM